MIEARIFTGVTGDTRKAWIDPHQVTMVTTETTRMGYGGYQEICEVLFANGERVTVEGHYIAKLIVDARTKQAGDS